MKIAAVAAVVTLAITGCASQPFGAMPNQTKQQREAQIQTANLAVQGGNFAQAEKLMGAYMYRDKQGELRFKSLGVSSASHQLAVDTVALMLWDTGRDATLESYAKRYLSGYDKEVMLCRLAERNAVYEKAYNCWNELGDVDRARRTVRTESALRILKD